jgi:hypothetical protein
MATVAGGPPTTGEFIAFLAELAAGAGSRDDWERLVVAHYQESHLEEARRDLVRASMAAGDWSWEGPPQSLRDAARELHTRVCARARA